MPPIGMNQKDFVKKLFRLSMETEKYKHIIIVSNKKIIGSYEQIDEIFENHTDPDITVTGLGLKR